MICRCVISGLLLMLVFLMLFLRPGKEALQSRSLAAAALSTRNDTEARADDRGYNEWSSCKKDLPV